MECLFHFLISANAVPLSFSHISLWSAFAFFSYTGLFKPLQKILNKAINVGSKTGSLSNSIYLSLLVGNTETEVCDVLGTGSDVTPC